MPTYIVRRGSPVYLPDDMDVTIKAKTIAAAKRKATLLAIRGLDLAILDTSGKVLWRKNWEVCVPDYWSHFTEWFSREPANG